MARADAVRHRVACPVCGAPAGEHCHGRTFSRARNNHGARVLAYRTSFEIERQAEVDAKADRVMARAKELLGG